MITTNPPLLHTIFGNAHFDGEYYKVYNTDDNSYKKLHRIIYEKFWGVELPEEIIIHHKNGNKLDNCILNLEAMTIEEHTKLHDFDRKMGLSNRFNTTGYFRVIKNFNKNCKQGFTYRYQYWEDGVRKYISSVSLEKLEDKVKSHGLEWRQL